MTTFHLHVVVVWPFPSKKTCTLYFITQSKFEENNQHTCLYTCERDRETKFRIQSRNGNKNDKYSQSKCRSECDVMKSMQVPAVGKESGQCTISPVIILCRLYHSTIIEMSYCLVVVVFSSLWISAAAYKRRNTFCFPIQVDVCLSFT